jgi:hypothetical protein
MAMYTYSSPTHDAKPDVADLRKQAAALREEIQKKDAMKRYMDPNSWDDRKRVAEWDLNRHSKVAQLRKIERDIGWQADANHTLAPSGVWRNDIG